MLRILLLHFKGKVYVAATSPSTMLRAAVVHRYVPRIQDREPSSPWSLEGEVDDVSDSVKLNLNALGQTPFPVHAAGHPLVLGFFFSDKSIPAR